MTAFQDRCTAEGTGEADMVDAETKESGRNDTDIHDWYEGHAHEFSGAQVVERAFIGKSTEFQNRLNRFKLWAIDERRNVDLDGKRVLEFGGGHGRLPLTYRGMLSYVGVDYSNNLIAIGNRRLKEAGLSNRARLVHGNAITYSEGERDFDVVCSLGMMAYFPDPTPVVTNMVRFLKPGGTLFFDFRVDSWIYSPIRKLKWMLRPPTGGTTYLRTPHALRSLLSSLGLANIQFRHREFPFLAEHYAASGRAWPLALRNTLAIKPSMWPLATESWVFASKPNPA